MRRVALIGALAVLAGCGGGEKKASVTEAEWLKRADAACERATDAIVKRGAPIDVRTLQTVGPDAAEDIRAAITEIRKLPVPPAAKQRVQLFVSDLEPLDPMLDDLVRGSTAMDLKGLAWAATRLEGKLAVLVASARRTGLRRCLQHGIPHVAIESIRAPVSAEQIARLDLQFSKRVDAATAKPGTIPSVRRTVTALAKLEKALATVRAPGWAHDELAAYRSSVQDFREGLAELLGRLRAGRPTPRGWLRRVTKDAPARVQLMHRRLAREIGAAPSTRPPSPQEEA